MRSMERIWKTTRNFDLVGRSEYLRRMTKYFSVQCPPICETALLCLKIPRLRPLFFIRVAIRQKRVRRSDGIIGTQETGSTRRKACPSATLCTTNLAYASLAFNPDLRSDRSPANHKLMARF
jgi:hypothetical protein